MSVTSRAACRMQGQGAGSTRTGFPLAVDSGESHKGADEYHQVRQGQQQPPPIDVEHGEVWTRCEDAMCAEPGNESKGAWRLAPCVRRCCTRAMWNLSYGSRPGIGLHYPANQVGMNSLQG
jgi:hypothetical protein